MLKYGDKQLIKEALFKDFCSLYTKCHTVDYEDQQLLRSAEINVMFMNNLNRVIEQIIVKEVSKCSKK